MLDSSLAFSDLPIRLLFGVGMLALAVAVVYGAIVLAARLTGLIVEPGYAPTVLLIAGFGALNALGLSVVGAYAWRAFENTKGRPLAIVQRRFTFGEGAAAGAASVGVTMSVFKHPQALCESKKVGPRTRIWAFAHVLPGARIGADCNICDHTFIENDVTVGDRVTVKCGVQLWDGVRIEDDVFIGPNATFANDRFPRSRQRPKAFLTTVVKEGASIGANATILPGITIGRGAMVGAGAVVVASVPPYAVVVGNPARIVSYCDAGPSAAQPAVRTEAARAGRAACAASSSSTLPQSRTCAAKWSRARSRRSCRSR